MEPISVAEAKSRFSELISRASSGERFVIQRRERPVAALISVDELERLERNSKAIYQLVRALGQSEDIIRRVEAGELHPVMLAFGLGRDDPMWETLTEEIYANRLTQPSRPEVSYEDS